MKTHRFPILLTLLILGGVLLSACTGAGTVNTWPGISATPKTVFLADQGSVFAVDASNGSLAWRFPQKADNSKPFYAPPAISDTMIVAGTYGHILYGIDPSGNSTPKWTFNSQNGNQVGGNFVGTPLIFNDVVLAPATNGLLYSLKLNNGQENWNFRAKNALWATPACDGKVVYQPALDHKLYALNLSDGKQIWAKDLGSALIGPAVLTKDGILYQTTMDGNVVAVKAADGSILWTAKTGGRIWGYPVQQADLLYIGNANGKVSAISTKDGSIAWQKDAGSAIIASGAVFTDGVVFVTEGGSVIAYSFDGQKELWRQAINGKLYTTPVIAGQSLVVAVTGGDKLLQAFGLNGQLSWPFVAPK